MQPTTLQIEYHEEIFKVEIFQGRNINSEKNQSSIIMYLHTYLVNRMYAVMLLIVRETVAGIHL